MLLTSSKVNQSKEEITVDDSFEDRVCGFGTLGLY